MRVAVVDDAQMMIAETKKQDIYHKARHCLAAVLCQGFYRPVFAFQR